MRLSVLLLSAIGVIPIALGSKMVLAFLGAICVGDLSLSGGIFEDKTSRDSCLKNHSPRRDDINFDVFSLSAFLSWVWDALFEQSLKHQPLH